MMSESVEAEADQGVQQLQQQLSRAQNEVERLQTQGGKPSKGMRELNLQDELQKVQTKLGALKAASPNTDMQAW